MGGAGATGLVGGVPTDADGLGWWSDLVRRGLCSVANGPVEGCDDMKALRDNVGRGEEGVAGWTFTSGAGL